VSELDEQGWVVVRNVVPPDELAAFTDIFTTLIPDVPYPRGRDGRIVWEFTGSSHHHEGVAAIARNPRFGALVARALNASRVQLLQDSLLYKPAHEGGTVEWHQDHTYVGFFNEPRVVALRIALLPEDESNGCMRVVDGSHRWGPVGDVRALREARVDSVLPSLTDAQRDAIAHARPLTLAAGDVSIHHCLTLHGSLPNTSAQPRRTIILRMFDGACRLDRSALPAGSDQHFPTDDDGHLSSDRFPIVFDSEP
jgi:ectoine hydroxylase-related dioxygenase (phytanoyl-CoA dioxygenase family)